MDTGGGGTAGRRKLSRRLGLGLKLPVPIQDHSGFMGDGGRFAFTAGDVPVLPRAGDEIGSSGDEIGNSGVTAGGIAARKTLDHKIKMELSRYPTAKGIYLRNRGRAAKMRSNPAAKGIYSRNRGRAAKTVGSWPHILVRIGGEIKLRPQEQCGVSPSIYFYMNQDSCVGSLVEHVSSGDSGKNGNMEDPCSGSSMDQSFTMKIGYCGMAAGKQELQSLTPEHILSGRLRVDDQNMEPMHLNLRLEHVVVKDKPMYSDISCVGSKNRGDRSKNGDVDELCSGSSDMNQIGHGDMAAWEEMLQPLTPEQMPEKRLSMPGQNMDLLCPGQTWEQVVVKVLHMIRCQQLTEFNEKLHLNVPTRFCEFNIAFFDLDKESIVEPGPLFSEIPEFEYRYLEDSINVVSIKVESDVVYPIDIFGTVLARDQYDYRCVYLFKRGKDDPQRITSSDNNTLTLTGPNRALAVTDSMFFEFDLKIKSDGAVDKDFCKGLLEHNVARHTLQPMTLSVESCLSTVDMVYTIVPYALEASLAINVLKGPFNFTGKVTAWTTENKNKITLYDSKVAGTQRKLGNGISVVSTCVLAVPLGEELVLSLCVYDDDREAECLELVMGHDAEENAPKLGPYELQVKIIWRGVLERRRPNMWEYFGDVEVLQ